MKLTLVAGQTRYRAPRAAVAAAIVLVALGLIVAATPRHTAGPVVCPFRAVTGFPCPTCGLIRSAGCILRGEFADAWRTNPLDATVMTVVAPAFLLLWMANAVGGWALRIEAGPRERKVLWALALLVVACNWVYVLTVHAR